MLINECPYITKFSAWAPGVENSKEWEEWALGKREITACPKGPDILFTEPMFRRRLSQISKMTIQVVHNLLPVEENTKIIFLSFRGEVSRQFTVTKMLIQDNDIMPASFSLSVFNTPAALTSIAFGLKGGYSAVYPAGNSFAAGLSLTEAAFIDGESTALANELIFVYADEQIPSEYREISFGTPLPLAYGFVLTRKPCDISIPLSSFKESMDTPEAFLKRLILSKLGQISF